MTGVSRERGSSVGTGSAVGFDAGLTGVWEPGVGVGVTAGGGVIVSGAGASVVGPASGVGVGVISGTGVGVCGGVFTG